jgi:hypothetical protein
LNKLGWGLDKEGYYRSYWTYSSPVDKTTKKMLPWNPVVTTIVRRVINPIPMVAKKVATKLTTLPESLGYDLVLGDWVTPAGKGVASDLIFQVDGVVRDEMHYHAVLSLTFLRDTDGVAPFVYPLRPTDEENDISMGSSLLIPHRAPETGYVPRQEWTVSRAIKPTDYPPYNKRNDCNNPIVLRFRIRSSTNESGVVTNAYYGQIRKVRFLPPGLHYPKGEPREGYLSFTYYLNPTPNDHNLEFDPKQTVKEY